MEVRRRRPEGAAPEGKAAPERWGLLFAGGVTVIYMVVASLALVGLALLEGIDLRQIQSLSMGTMLLGDGIGKVFALGAALGIRALLPREGTGRPAPARGAAGAGALAGIAFLAVSFGISWVQLLAYGVAGREYKPQEVVLQALGADGSTQAFFVIFAVVLAPVFEEFLFRGFLFGGLRRWTGPWGAAVLSAAAFAAFHMEIDAMPVLFVLGIALARLRERTGGLVAPMAMHACFNAVQVCGILLARGG